MEDGDHNTHLEAVESVQEDLKSKLSVMYTHV